jgi:3-methylcrotonyl-CoA carboxylase alpha subunit
MSEILINQRKFAATAPQGALPLKIEACGGGVYHLVGPGCRYKLVARQTGKDLWVFLSGHVYQIAKAAAKSGTMAAKGGEQAADEAGEIISPMPAKVFKLHVKNGDAVKRDQELVILEAMKMEHGLCAPKDGVVERCAVREGDMVAVGQELMVVK